MNVVGRASEVSKLLIEGCSDQEIAGELGISARTVKQHLRTLYAQAEIRDGRKRVRLIQVLTASTDKFDLPQMPEREKEIATLAIKGFTNPEIAEQCATSEQMIKNHLRNIFDKCGVWSRAELAARFRAA